MFTSGSRVMAVFHHFIIYCVNTFSAFTSTSRVRRRFLLLFRKVSGQTVSLFKRSNIFKTNTPVSTNFLNLFPMNEKLQPSYRSPAAGTADTLPVTCMNSNWASGRLQKVHLRPLRQFYCRFKQPSAAVGLLCRQEEDGRIYSFWSSYPASLKPGGCWAAFSPSSICWKTFPND